MDVKRSVYLLIPTILVLICGCVSNVNGYIKRNTWDHFSCLPQNYFYLSSNGKKINKAAAFAGWKHRTGKQIFCAASDFMSKLPLTITHVPCFPPHTSNS